jgi:hypothetical protein
VFEFAVYLAEHFSIAALVIALGLVLDYVATPALKLEVVTWLRTGTFAISLRNLLTGFLDGFIYRLFSAKTFSFTFFLRSSAISSVFLVVILLLQFILDRDPLSQFENLGPNFGIATLVLIVFLLTNFVIDYVSNVQTIVFLRMAAATGRVSDAIVAFYSDLIVTLAIFTFLFPLAIIASVEISAATKTTHLLRIKEADEKFTALVQGAIPKPRNPNGEFNLPQRVVSIGVRTDEENKDFPLFPSGNLYLFAPIGTSAVESAVEFLRLRYPTMKILAQSNDVASVEIAFAHPSLVFGSLWGLYYSGYRASNVTRDGFWGLVSLEPTPILASSVMGAALQEAADSAIQLVKCTSGEWKDIPGKTLDTILPCDAAVVVADRIRSGGLMSIASAALPTSSFPVTPFFMTSFSASLLYYCSIFVSAAGIAILRMIQKVSATPYLDLENKPFTILSIVTFPVVLLLIFVARL